MRRNKAGAPILDGHPAHCPCKVCAALRGEISFPYVCRHCDEVVVRIIVTDPAQRRMARQRTQLHEVHCQGPAV